MSLGIGRTGAPGYVAEIPFSIAAKQGLMQDFYESCAKLCYRDIMALSRALNLRPQSIERYKYQTRFPRWEIAVDIINWVRAGKPMRRIPLSQIHTQVM